MRFLAALATATGMALGQGMEFIKANYTKHEFEIPMRDGVKLYTTVFTPKDTSRTYPILMNRTPYSLRPYGVDQYRDSLGPHTGFAKSGYIFVYQDVRGRWASEGKYEHVRPHKPSKAAREFDESTDTYDTLDWLVKNIPGNNGRAGMWGISYPGFYAAMGAIDSHPSLKASSPQAPVADWFIGDDFHHNGAFFLAHAFNFLVRADKPRPEPSKEDGPPFDHKTPDGYQFFLRIGPLANANERFLKNNFPFWNDMMRHANYDEFWQARNIRPHLKAVRPAILTVGGWYDAEDLFGALKVYEAIGKQSPGADNRLVMGPWYHGQWGGNSNAGESLGNVHFNSKTSDYYREKIELPFFEHYLKGKGDLDLPAASMFETGRNQWRKHDAWPPRLARDRTLYFRAEGKLAWDPPAEDAAFDEYVSDPAKPVPTVDYTAIGMTREYMTDDQRFATSRPDVLTYQTEALKEDVTLAGPLNAVLHVSVTGTDADFVVKLVDVFPDNHPDNKPNPREVKMGGYQALVRGEPFRGRFRRSFTAPVPFNPGQTDKIEFELPDVYHTFRRDHRIMVQVQSSWFPLVDRNPQKFVDIYTAREQDFQRATHRVYRQRPAASALRVKILPGL
ncbi:MAG: CocE/NonD family hydrolase [Acidobacteria bacterium]|nr:CocE/NonD family hydrolase [Acidobacteriota bacterium]